MKLLSKLSLLQAFIHKKNWFLFTTRRTPNKMIERINKLASKNNNLIISNNNYDEIIKKASVKFVTQDSVNMVYEGLSTKGQTFLFNMKYIKVNKIVDQMNQLFANKQVGYIENIKMADDLNKIKTIPQNLHNDVFAEVEKVAYKLMQKIKLKEV
ncbi:mitochondrial fission ELM1 family protein [Gammaproteobacteria bacterium]|nr:mitochondrial fission ELM1 family protein [Gammaproteobacteria bacterium]